MFGMKKTWTLEKEIISKEEFCDAMSAIEAMVCCVDDTRCLEEKEPLLRSIEAGEELSLQADVLSACVPSVVNLLLHAIGVRDENDRRKKLIWSFIFGDKEPELGNDTDDYEKLYDVLTKPLH